MWPIFNDVAWFVCLPVCACLLVINVSHAKMTELTKILFGVWTQGAK